MFISLLGLARRIDKLRVSFDEPKIDDGGNHPSELESCLLEEIFKRSWFG